MPSRNFNVRLPENLEKALFECINESAATNFFRAAIAEKLNRDFGKNVDVEKMVRGMRNDMKTEAGRAAAEENLRRARERKKDYATIRRNIREFLKSGIVDLGKHGRREAYFSFKTKNTEHVCEFKIPAALYLTKADFIRKFGRQTDYELSLEEAKAFQKHVFETAKQALLKHENDGEEPIGFSMGAGKPPKPESK